MGISGLGWNGSPVTAGPQTPVLALFLLERVALAHVDQDHSHDTHILASYQGKGLAADTMSTHAPLTETAEAHA